MSAAAESRYAALPLFLAGVFFMVAAPLFWTQVEAPVGKTVERAAENAELFHRVAPSAAYGFGRLRAGELPLWCDGQMCGMPWLADPQNGVFQPLNAVFLFLPPGPGLAVQAFLCLFLMGLLFTLFCRSLGARHVPAAAGGIVYAFGGASAAVMSRPEMAAAMTWAPLVFWSVAEHVRSPRRATLAAGGVAYGLLLLSGSGPLALLFTGMLGVYAVVGAAGRRFSVRTDLLKMAGLGVLLSSAQLVPAAFWLATLDHPVEVLLRADTAGMVPSSPLDFLEQLLAPRPGLLPRMGYFGAAVPALILPAFFRRGMRRTLAFFLVSGVTCVLAVVSAGGLFGEWFPRACWMPGLAFCVAGMAALGLDRLLSPRRDPRSPRLWAPLFFVFVAAAALFLATPAETKGRIVPVLAALAFFAVFRASWASLLSGAAVAFILFADLFAASSNVYQHPLRGGEGVLSGGRRLGRIAREQALDGRVLVSSDPLNPGLSPNEGLLGPFRVEGGAFLALTPEQSSWWGAYAPGDGESGVTPGGARPFLRVDGDMPAPGLAGLAGVRVVVTDTPEAFHRADGARLRSVGAESGVSVLVNDDAQPRARLVPKWRVVPDAAAALALLTSDGFDPARECAVSSLLHLGGLRESQNTGAGAGTARVTAETPERVELSAEAPAPSMLVLADTHAPGWAATVNGAAAHIYQVNARFRGVLVPAGASTVVMTYRPWPVYAGMAVSLLTLAGLFLAALAEMARAARGGRKAGPAVRA